MNIYKSLTMVTATSLLVLLSSTTWRSTTRHSIDTPTSDRGTSGPRAERVDLDIPARRRPVKVAVAGTGNRLIVANQRTGSLSLVDLENSVVIGEWKVADRVGDLVALGHNRFLLSDQSQTGKLVSVKLTDNDQIRTEWSQDTIGYPNQICVDHEHQRCYVTGLWSRQIASHDLGTSDQPGTRIASAETRFAGGKAILIQQGSVMLVTDAFGSSWASFRCEDLEPIQSGALGTRRLCGLHTWIQSDSGEPAVAIVSQPLNRLAQAIRNDVHWGLMVANEVVVRDENSFVVAGWEESRRSSIPLGGPGEAKGDPESIAFASSGEVAITIGGVGEVAIGDLVERSFAYVPTGARPVHSCFSDDGKTLYVANQLDDSITIVDVTRYETTMTIPLGKQPARDEVDQGERLFFDATVSHDSWMSCHSCHVNGHTNGFLNDNFSDQSFGAPKRVLSLLGHGDTAPFAWNGSAETLEEQIRSSIERTMQTDDEIDNAQIQSLVDFVKSLPPPPSLAAARQSTNKDAIKEGAVLFKDLGCAVCHAPPYYTSANLEQVGAVDELGKDQFNPPSLIGVSQRQSLFHDGRYSNTRQVLEDEKHQLPRDLTKAELERLNQFLMHL